MRLQLQPAYLLHRRPFRDSSELLDILSAEHGRLGLVARGLNRKRRGGPLASVLQPFRPLLISCSGRGDLLTLTEAEVAGELGALRAESLLSAFYLSELLIRLLSRFAPYPAVFVAYAEALGELSAAGGGAAPEAALRRFEFTLLKELGYLVDLTATAYDGECLLPGAFYRLDLERGFIPAAKGDDVSQRFSGEALNAIAAGNFDAPFAEPAKRLVRLLLQPHLGESPLRSRALFARKSSGLQASL